MATPLSYRGRAAASPFARKLLIRRENARVRDRLALDDPRLVEQEPRQLVELIPLASSVAMAAMRRVSSCWPLISSTRLESLSSWLCCFRNRSSRRSSPCSPATRHTALSLSRFEGRTSVTSSPSEAFEARDQPLELDVAQGLRRVLLRRLAVALDSGEVDVAAGQRAEGVAPVVLDLLQPELVDRVVQEQHFHALGQRLLELRAGPRPWSSPSM